MYNLNTMQRAIALSAVGLAMTASPALAQPDHPATHVTQSPAGAAAGSSLDLRSPDAVDASRDSVPTDLRSPDAADAGSAPIAVTGSLAGTTSASPEVKAAAETAKADDGVNWGSIGIGAGAIAAVALIGLAGVAMTQRGRMRTARQ